jgi:hypothetical protein
MQRKIQRDIRIHARKQLADDLLKRIRLADAARQPLPIEIHSNANPCERSIEVDPTEILNAIYVAAKNGTAISAEVRVAITRNLDALANTTNFAGINRHFENCFQLQDEKRVKQFFYLLMTLGIFAKIFPTLSAKLTSEKATEISQIVNFICNQSKQFSSKKTKLKLFYDQLLAIFEENPSQELMNENKVIAAYYALDKEKLLPTASPQSISTPPKPLTEKEKLMAGYNAANINPHALSVWLHNKVFGYGKAVQNFDLLLETGLLKTLFPLLSDKLQEEKAILHKILALVDSQAWEKDAHRFAEYNAGYRLNYLQYIYAHFLASMVAEYEDPEDASFDMPFMMSLIQDTPIMQHAFGLDIATFFPSLFTMAVLRYRGFTLPPPSSFYHSPDGIKLGSNPFGLYQASPQPFLQQSFMSGPYYVPLPPMQWYNPVPPAVEYPQPPYYPELVYTGDYRFRS